MTIQENGDHKARYKEPLICIGVEHVKRHVSTLRFYFTRPLTDEEVVFLFDTVKEAADRAPEWIREEDENPS